MRWRIIEVLALVAVLAGCEPTIASRGAIIDPDQLSQIKPGISTREDVANKLGTPTEVSTFDDKTWYYIGRQTKQYSFLDPKILKQEGVKVTFNDQGVVTGVDKLDLSQARDITPAPGSTPTYGTDHTLIQQLLGNLSHPIPDMGQNEPHPGGEPGGEPY